MVKEVKMESVKEKFFRKEWLILFVIFSVIALIFFILLNVVTDSGFGLVEILFTIVFGFLMASFLVWTKSLTFKNAYMGTGIGLIGLFVLEYGFYLRYRGPYSTTFMIVGGLVVLAYLGLYFWKFRKFDKYIEGEFDDR